MRQLPPAATALIVAKQKAELEISREITAPEPMIVRSPDPPPPPLAQSKQIARRMDGIALPAPTGVQAWTEPTKEHNWDSGNRNAPAWLNGGITGEKTCSVCGVTQITSLIQADRAGMEYVYRDAWGNTIKSMEPLNNCPVFIGDPNGAILDGRTKIRGLTGEMHEVKYDVEGLSERMSRLERENAALREAMAKPQTIDATALIDFLARMVSLSVQTNGPTVPVIVAEKQYALPEPVADVIIQVAARERVLLKRDKN